MTTVRVLRPSDDSRHLCHLTELQIVHDSLESARLAGKDKTAVWGPRLKPHETLVGNGLQLYIENAGKNLAR